MLKRSYILEILKSEGYDISSRTLTDWVAKKYIPKFSSTGRGSDKVYFSKDHNIMQRIKLVAALMQANCGSQTVLLALLFNGYDIPAKVLKDSYRGRIQSMGSEIKKIVDHPLGEEEGIASFAASYAKKVLGYLSLNETMDGIEEFTKLVMGTFTPRDDANLFITNTLNKILEKKGFPMDILNTVDIVLFSSYAAKLQQFLSVPGMQSVILEASTSEIRKARNYSLQLSEVFFPKVADILPPPGRGLPLKECFTVSLGQALIPVLIHLGKIDHKKVKHSVAITIEAIEKIDVMKFYESLKQKSVSMEELAIAMDAITEIGMVWQNSDGVTFFLPKAN